MVGNHVQLGFEWLDLVCGTEVVLGDLWKSSEGECTSENRRVETGALQSQSVRSGENGRTIKSDSSQWENGEGERQVELT